MSNYWLFKSEPDCYSLSDLKRDGKTFWDGVRNYQARNFLRDSIKKGDGVLFYHSNAKPMAVAGSMTVVKEGYPDHTAFDPESDHYDEASTPDNPVWYMVDVKFKAEFKEPVTREALKADARLDGMVLLQKGSRLSIQPVTAEEWRIVHEIAGIRI